MNKPEPICGICKDSKKVIKDGDFQICDLCEEPYCVQHQGFNHMQGGNYCD